MPQQIDSRALEFVRQALGLAGGAGASQNVLLEDGIVDQTLEVSQLVSSSGPTTDSGLFVIQASQVHPGAGDLSDTLDPYAPGTVAAGQIRPSDFHNYDVWLHRASLRTSSPGSALIGAGVELDCGSRFMAVTDGAGTVFDVTLCAFDGPAIADGSGGFALTSQPISMKLPESATGLILSSSVSAAVTVRVSILAELVPRGLRPSAF